MIVVCKGENWSEDICKSVNIWWTKWHTWRNFSVISQRQNPDILLISFCAVMWRRQERCQYWRLQNYSDQLICPMISLGRWVGWRFKRFFFFPFKKSLPLNLLQILSCLCFFWSMNVCWFFFFLNGIGGEEMSLIARYLEVAQIRLLSCK